MLFALWFSSVILVFSLLSHLDLACTAITGNMCCLKTMDILHFNESESMCLDLAWDRKSENPK